MRQWVGFALLIGCIFNHSIILLLVSLLMVPAQAVKLNVLAGIEIIVLVLAYSTAVGANSQGDPALSTRQAKVTLTCFAALRALCLRLVFDIFRSVSQSDAASSTDTVV